MGQETGKVCRDNMFKPSQKKNILLLRLDIGTKMSKPDKYDVYSGQKCRNLYHGKLEGAFRGCKI